MDAKEVCLVTGANRGLGLATAEGLARDGATVVLACRDLGRGQEALQSVRQHAAHEHVHLMQLNLAEPESVRDFARAFAERFDRLDVLVNNAGLTQTELELSTLGLELGWHVGYLGHLQLTRLLLPLLDAGAPSRVVWLCGLYQKRGELRLDDLAWQKRPWDWGQAGSDAQLAKVMATVELSRRLAGSGVTVNAVHPGAVRTHAQDAMPLPLRILMDTVLRPIFVRPERGARTVLRLAEDEALVETSGCWFRRYEAAEPNPLAMDEEARMKLWRHSSHLLGLPLEL